MNKALAAVENVVPYQNRSYLLLHKIERFDIL